ncbi:MAG: Rrf2 family transcriptional regulator [Candidatus Marinimicrobia bacterium]|nr:Rrf2 family transcriptional regulator [Candidatus Neomarinimicrobiota bacterium]
MLYSKSAEYAIQAMIYLAEKNSPKPVMISEIAKAYNIPQQFLAKITQILVRHHLLLTVRGRNGGVLLGRPASEIYINKVVQAVDGPPPEHEQCVIGLDACSDEQPCPMHPKWSVIREQIKDMLEAENLEHLAKRVIEKRLAMHKLGIHNLVGSVD